MKRLYFSRIGIIATKMVSLTRRDRIESNESCSVNFNRVGVVSLLIGYSVAALHNALLAKIFSLTQILKSAYCSPSKPAGSLGPVTSSIRFTSVWADTFRLSFGRAIGAQRL
jgi:hypothetical protein